MNLAHLIVRQWRRRPARTVLSIISVAIAAAAVLGVTLSQASVRMGYRKLLEATEGRAALEIVAAEGGRFEAEQAGRIADVPGVSAAIPIATRATMARVHGKRVRAVMVGLPPEAAAAAQCLPLTAGEMCREADEAVMSADLAKSLGVEVGDRLVVLAQRGPRSATIVGLATSAPLAELAPAAALVMPLETVQQYYGLGNQVDRIRVLLNSSDVREQVQAAIAERLPADLAVQAPLAQMELAGSILRSTELALSFAGALSMAMAGFIVLNTLRMNFGERRRDMAVLRVLGVTSGQLIKLHLAEGVFLGLAGAVVGMPLGVLLGRGLAEVMRSLAGADIPVPETPYWTLAAALVAGPIVACVAALVPALESRGVSPVEALGDTEVRRGERFPLWAILTGLVVWSVATVLLLLVAAERVPPALAIPAGMLMLVGFIAVIPAVLAPVVRLCARLLAPLMPTEGDFAAEQLLQRPTRTVLTVGVLVAAISSGVGMGNAIINNVDDVRAWYRRMMTGDVMVTGQSSAEGLPASREWPSVRQVIAERPEVDYVAESRYFPARAGGVPTLCIVHEFDPRMELTWAASPQEEARLRAALKSGEIVVGGLLAKRLGVRAGDSLRLEIQGRVLSLKVAGSVRDYLLGGLAVFLDRAAAEKLIDLGPPGMYTIATKKDAPIEPLVAELKKVLGEEGLVVETKARVRGQLDLLIGGVVGALWGLVALGFVVGGMAVGNTLTMSVLEQTRELGLLRIIGMTRRQVRKLILCESLLVGILGIFMGTLAGVTTAWIIHICNEPLLGQTIPFAFHGWLLVANAAGCLAITVLAAWLPGERAARLDLLPAIACE